MAKILTKNELKQDVGDLLDYLHFTPDYEWNYELIRDKLVKNRHRLEKNVSYYNFESDPTHILEMHLKDGDMLDLIHSLTNTYNDLEKMNLKEEFKSS